MEIEKPSDTLILAMARENLEDCRRVLHDGPPGRFVPESLCEEIEDLLARAEALVAKLDP